MHPTARIRQSVSAGPAQAELRELVAQFAAEGHSKDAIYRFFEAALLDIRSAHHGEDSPEEEALLEVMDLLSGFCDPDLVLLPGA